MSGWNLPPGVTNAMIDAHFGGDAEECFCSDIMDGIVEAIANRPWFSAELAEEIADDRVFGTLEEMCDGCRKREKREYEEGAAEDAAYQAYRDRHIDG